MGATASINKTCAIDAALIDAVLHCKEVRVKQLLEEGASASATASNGYTALYLAAMRGHASIVSQLLAAGASVDEPSGAYTPLQVSVLYGRSGAAQQLLAAGADCSGKDNRGFSLLRAALDGPSPSPEVVSVVLGHCEACGNVEARSTAWRRRTPLMSAVQMNDTVDCVELLLNAGSVLDAEDDDNKTALQLAIEAGNEKNAILLIQCGARPSIKYFRHRRPRAYSRLISLMLRVERPQWEDVVNYTLLTEDLQMEEVRGDSSGTLVTRGGVIMTFSENHIALLLAKYHKWCQQLVSGERTLQECARTTLRDHLVSRAGGRSMAPTVARLHHIPPPIRRYILYMEDEDSRKLYI